MEAFTLDSTEIIVLATAGGLFLIQIIYYLCLYNRIHARSRAVKQGDTHFTQELPPHIRHYLRPRGIRESAPQPGRRAGAGLSPI